MKRLLMAATVVGLTASAALAGLTVTGTSTREVDGFAEIIFNITGFTGADDTLGNSVSGVEGAFTIEDGGGMRWLGASNASRKTNASNVGSGDRSWVNFESYAGNPVRTGTDQAATSFSATWFTTGGNELGDATRLSNIDLDPADEFDQTLLATILATPGKKVTFTGKFNAANVAQDLTFSFGGGPVGQNLKADVTVNPQGGVLGDGATVSVGNASVVAPDTRDSATIAGLSVTGAGWSQTGLSNGELAAGASQNGTVAYSGAGYLKGHVAKGQLSFNIDAPAGATGIGQKNFPLITTVNGNIGGGHALVDPNGSLAGLGSKSDKSLGSEASILGGNAGAGGADVSMSWAEQDPNANVPPKFSSLTSDVLNLTGLDGTQFVLAMTYDESKLNAPEASLAAWGGLQLLYFDTAAGAWVNAVEGNHGANVGPANVQGDYSAGMGLGAWGVNLASNMVWAVLDHNSQFAAVPEPSTIILLGIGLLGLVARARRGK